MITDMTKGSPAKLLLRFSLPMLISVIFQQLYTIADSVIAGNYIDKNALAAISASFPVTMIFMAIGTGSNIGCSVVVSSLFGAKDNTKMKTAIYTSLISITVIGTILTIAGFFVCSPILDLLNTSNDIKADAALYLSIYTGGLIFLFLYNICNGIYTALGDSKTPLLFLIISSISNVILDLVFVVVFGMGVDGIAWATFLCQGICSVLALVCLLYRIKKIEAEKSFPKFDWKMLARISRIAVPSILQQSFVSVGNLFIQGRINSFGIDATAGYGSAIKINTFAIMSFTTLGNSISSFTAQNIGAGKPERVKSGYRSGLFMICGIVLIFVSVFLIFKTQLISIFMDSSLVNNIGAIEIGSQFLMIVSPFYLTVAIKLASDGVLRGSGAIREFMATTFTDLIIRVVLAFIFSSWWGTLGIWISWPVGWTISAIMSVVFYLMGNWKSRTI